MKIDSNDINIDDLVDEKYFHKKVGEDLFLSDYQLSILRMNGINDGDYASLEELLFIMNEILDEDDNEELEEISKEISEFNYYHNVNK